MEPEGFVTEASWSSYDPTIPVEEPESIAQLFGSQEQDQDSNSIAQTIFWTDQSSDSYYCSSDTNYNYDFWPQGNCSNSSTKTSNFFPTNTDYESYCLNYANAVSTNSVNTVPVDFNAEDEQMATQCNPISQYNQLKLPVCMNEENNSDEVEDSIRKPPLPFLPTAKRRFVEDDLQISHTSEKDNHHLEGSKRKSRGSASMLKKGKCSRSKKPPKSSSPDTEQDSAVDINAQSSSCYSSEDDSNASQKPNLAGVTSSSSKRSRGGDPNGKTRADRGSATDPQSLYARKRRERINERLRILQNLVPNGTKVDISTMLEEAVQYVKFLQLQIKLLSSDELWMYAPIAYNGMNLGFDMQISRSLQQ